MTTSFQTMVAMRDGVALNSPVGQLFQLFDVRNVTVLKGPQSGRYGRNATAGVISIESIKPIPRTSPMISCLSKSSSSRSLKWQPT